MAPPARVSHEIDTLRAGFPTLRVVGDPNYSSEVDIPVGSARLPYVGSPERWTGALAWLTGLRSAEVSGVRAVVSLELFSASTRQANRLARRLGVPHAVIVAELLDSFPLYRLPPWSAYTRWAVHGVDLVLPLTNEGLRHVVRLGVDPDRCAVVSPGVDVRSFWSEAPRVDLPIVLFAGRFTPCKGVLDAISACDLVAERVPDLRMVVVGDGEQHDLVMAMQATRPWLEVRPRVPRSLMPALFRSARLLIAPSYSDRFNREQFGFALVEASLSRIAVAATDCGAFSEVLPSGHPLVEERDVEGMATLVELMLGAEGDRWAAASQQMAAQKFDVAAQGRRLAHEINDLIGRYERRESRN